MRVWSRGFLVLLISLCLVGCGRPIEHNPKQHVFVNGDKAIINGEQVSVYNKHGQLLQQSTFHSPTLLEARSFLTDIQQDLTAKHYADFLQGDIAYPLRVSSDHKTQVYQNAVQLQAAFNTVFSPQMLHAIIQQDPYRLIAHPNGVSMVNGQVLFNKRGIHSINQ